MDGENHITGRLEVICGSMFCGKTEELIRRVRRAAIAKQKVQVFKPVIDNRYGLETVSTHDGITIEARPIEFVEDMLQIVDATAATVVAIDEVQFFDQRILSVIDLLICRKVRVIVSGLDTDFRGIPFGVMPTLICIAEDVTKLHAICTVCGADACRTQSIINDKPAPFDSPLVRIGGLHGVERYEARCRIHHEVPRT